MTMPYYIDSRRSLPYIYYGAGITNTVLRKTSKRKEAFF